MGRRNYLNEGKLSGLGKYAQLARCLKLEKESAAETVRNISGLLRLLNHERLEKSDNKKWISLFRKRNAEEILKSGVSYGCTDDATVFVSLARACGIPARYVTGLRKASSGGHNWAEVLLDGVWIPVEPQSCDMPYDYEKDETGPYLVLSKSLDASDSAITCYEDWLKLEEKRRACKK